MALALPLLIGLALAPFLGGRWSRLGDLRLRGIAVFYVAIGLQLAAFPVKALPWRTPDRIAVVLWLSSYALFALGTYLNLRTPGFALVGIGMLSNIAAVTTNGGHMPALPSALRGAGLHFHQSRNSTVANAPHLSWLVDRWAVPQWIPWGNVFSVGDVLIAAGGLVFALAATGSLKRSRPLPTPALSNAGVALPGEDVSVISWGELLPTALAAASRLRTAGISVEVVCPGDQSRWDKQVVLATTEKTSKVLIAGNSGLDAAIAATLVEEAFYDLDAPIRRLGAPDIDELTAALRELAEH